MARFITRIELHNAVWPDDYDKLHSFMLGAGFSKSISNDKGIKYDLPTAEYYLEGNYELSAVFQKAKNAAIFVGKKFGIITSLTVSSMWEGLPISH